MGEWSAHPAEAREVIVAVGGYDRRMVTAATFACGVPAARRRAVHVATDPRAAVTLGSSWMRAAPCDLPLEIVDDEGGVPMTIAALARAAVAAGAAEVVVVTGRLTMRGPYRRLLHDETARRIGDALDGLAGVRWVCLPVPF